MPAVRGAMPIHEREDLRPRCPHCQTDLAELVARPLRSRWGRRFVYACPNCRSVLGVSHRKGFWMG